MKKIIPFFLLLFLLYACCKKETTLEAIVHHDGTGDYLKISNKEYYVCNYKILDNYEDGQVVKITYEAMNECYDEYDRIRCAMVYPSDGFIRVKYIEES